VAAATPHPLVKLGIVMCSCKVTEQIVALVR
jgi:hypothetical protein